MTEDTIDSLRYSVRAVMPTLSAQIPSESIFTDDIAAAYHRQLVELNSRLFPTVRDEDRGTDRDPYVRQSRVRQLPRPTITYIGTPRQEDRHMSDEITEMVRALPEPISEVKEPTKMTKDTMTIGAIAFNSSYLGRGKTELEKAEIKKQATFILSRAKLLGFDAKDLNWKLVKEPNEDSFIKDIGVLMTTLVKLADEIKVKACETFLWRTKNLDLEKVKELGIRQEQSKLSTLKTTFNEMSDTSNDLMKDYFAIISEMRKIRKSMDNQEKAIASYDSSTFLSKINSNNSPFTLIEIKDNKLFYITKQPLIIKNINKSAGIHEEVNLGYFCMVIEETYLRVYAVKDNISARGYFHPHISNTQVCLGNALDIVTTALIDRDYERLCCVMWDLLSVYNPESPYMRLEYFIKGEKYDRGENSALMSAHQLDFSMTEEQHKEMLRTIGLFPIGCFVEVIKNCNGENGRIFTKGAVLKIKQISNNKIYFLNYSGSPITFSYNIENLRCIAKNDSELLERTFIIPENSPYAPTFGTNKLLKLFRVSESLSETSGVIVYMINSLEDCNDHDSEDFEESYTNRIVFNTNRLTMIEKDSEHEYIAKGYTKNYYEE